MAHIHDHDDVDRSYFCSHSCHVLYCDDLDIEVGGWNGCHEIEKDVPCDHCGGTVWGTNN